jgi:hypothetical protein
MRRRRGATLILAGLMLAATTTTVVTGVASAPAAAAASGPQCTFNSSSLPIVTGASAGEKIAVSCTGLPPLHPYLFMETSLILGIDPKAAPLLTGQIVSLSGLMALLAALPEINPNALTFPVSNLNGDLDFFYTLPSSQAPDPNAVCGPTAAEINDGLIGCALATIDLTSFKPVGPGSAVVEYAGDPLFPPNQTVAVGDAPGATTHWWLATLLALEGLLGGGSSPASTVTVTLTSTKGVTTTAANAVHVSPAVYNNPVLTPPMIGGTFTVPSTKIRGEQTVKVTYTAVLLGFPLSNSASTFLKVAR